MSLTNEIILENINRFGLDEVLANTDINDIEDDTIKIIFRTIKVSQSILVASLEEFVNDKKKITIEA